VVKIRKAITLEEAFYWVMIIWLALSILALLYDLIVVGLNFLNGNYNVTIPIHVGLSVPLS